MSLQYVTTYYRGPNGHTYLVQVVQAPELHEVYQFVPIVIHATNDCNCNRTDYSYERDSLYQSLVTLADQWSFTQFADLSLADFLVRTLGGEHVGTLPGEAIER